MFLRSVWLSARVQTYQYMIRDKPVLSRQLFGAGVELVCMVSGTIAFVPATVQLQVPGLSSTCRVTSLQMTQGRSSLGQHLFQVCVDACGRASWQTVSQTLHCTAVGRLIGSEYRQAIFLVPWQHKMSTSYSSWTSFLQGFAFGKTDKLH